MQPFEELISQLGELMGTQLQADSRQSCCIEFPGDGVTVQVDLDTTGERILVGCDLGPLTPGIYREQVLARALKVNALPRTPRGALAYSERKDSLVLFQYLPIASLQAEEFFNFLQRFVNHARLWLEALAKGDLPQVEEGPSTASGMMGLR